MDTAAKLQALFRDVELPEIAGINFGNMTHAEIAELLPPIGGKHPLKGILIDKTMGKAYGIASGWDEETVIHEAMSFKAGALAHEAAIQAGSAWERLGNHLEAVGAAFMRKMGIANAVMYINGRNPCWGSERCPAVTSYCRSFWLRDARWLCTISGETTSSVLGRTGSFILWELPIEGLPMAQWKLVDYSEPADSPDDFPKIVIASEAQLRDELERFKDRPPSIVGLSSPNDGGLQIGLGGPLAGVRWGDCPRSKNTKTILADRQYSSKRIDFASEEDSLAFWPDELIPAEQAIAIAAHFFTHQELPDWVNWKEWDANALEWRTRKEFLQKSLDERRRLLAEQAELMKVHYEQTAEERQLWQSGDFENEG